MLSILQEIHVWADCPQILTALTLPIYNVHRKGIEWCGRNAQKHWMFPIMRSWYSWNKSITLKTCIAFDVKPDRKLNHDTRANRGTFTRTDKFVMSKQEEMNYCGDQRSEKILNSEQHSMWTLVSKQSFIQHVFSHYCHRRQFSRDTPKRYWREIMDQFLRYKLQWKYSHGRYHASANNGTNSGECSKSSYALNIILSHVVKASSTSAAGGLESRVKIFTFLLRKQCSQCPQRGLPTKRPHGKEEVWSLLDGESVARFYQRKSFVYLVSMCRDQIVLKDFPRLVQPCVPAQED